MVWPHNVKNGARLRIVRVQLRFCCNHVLGCIFEPNMTPWAETLCVTSLHGDSRVTCQFLVCTDPGCDRPGLYTFGSVPYRPPKWHMHRNLHMRAMLMAELIVDSWQHYITARHVTVSPVSRLLTCILVVWYRCMWMIRAWSGDPARESWHRRGVRVAVPWTEAASSCCPVPGMLIAPVNYRYPDRLPLSGTLVT